jgi:hypothetical protein
MAMVRRDLALAKVLDSMHVAQVDGFALVVGHLDADGDLPAMRSMRMLGAHGEAEVVGEAGDARVFDAGFGLELVGGDHGAGVDLDDLAADVELGAFLDQGAGFFAEFVFADGLGAFAGVEQGAGRQLEAADVLGRDGGGADFGVGAAVDGDAAAEELAKKPGLTAASRLRSGSGSSRVSAFRARLSCCSALRSARSSRQLRQRS